MFLHLAEHPDDTIRLVSDHIGLAERTVAGIIADLRADGYLLAAKQGTRNVYSVDSHLSLRHPELAERTVGDLLGAMVGRRKAARVGHSVGHVKLTVRGH